MHMSCLFLNLSNILTQTLHDQFVSSQSPCFYWCSVLLLFSATCQSHLYLFIYSFIFRSNLELPAKFFDCNVFPSTLKSFDPSKEIPHSYCYIAVTESCVFFPQISPKMYQKSCYKNILFMLSTNYTLHQNNRFNMIIQ